jgi:two-component system, response regulator YesN
MELKRLYNVIIVDDEPVIRFGLKASVNWEDEGLQLIGAYSNGQEALDAMVDRKVDILITDIKMPVMDGLTLMKKALEQFPKLKIILVSSYNDFAYVREALMHGAVDYVLKPTLEPEELINLIHTCVEKIKDDQIIEEKLNLIEHSEFLQKRRKFEQELKHVLLDNTEEVPFIEDIPWFEGPITMGVLSIKSVGRVDEQYGSLHKSLLLEEVQELVYEKHPNAICFSVGETELCFLVEKKETSHNDILKIKQNLEAKTDIHFTFGYEENLKLKDAKEGFHKCLAALNQKFFYDNQDIFRFEPEKKEFKERLKLEEMKKALFPAQDEQVIHFVKQRQAEWMTQKLHPDDIKAEACDILTTLFMDGIEISELLEKCAEIKRLESLKELNQYLLEQIEQYHHPIMHRSEKSGEDNELMRAALEYIQDHYTDELTLQHVANHIHISRNYFSILFKKFYNQNFIDYVIDLRINRAKRLLQHTSLKVYEIADQSGFKDVKYFSKLFKKMTGHSPGDFRGEVKK